MKSSFDRHLEFDLPYRYELNRSRGDDGSTNVSILCDPSYNDSHERVGDVTIRLAKQNLTIAEDKRNLRGDFPAAYIGTISEMQLGIGVNGGSFSSNRQLVIQILMLIVAIEASDNESYTLIALKTGRESEESENIEKLTRHMNAVLGCLKLDGKSGNFARLSTYDVRRALKENAAKNEKDPLSGVRGSRRSSSSSTKPARSSAPSKPAQPVARPTTTSSGKPLRSEAELKNIMNRQLDARNKALAAARREAERRKVERKNAIVQAAAKNAEDLAAVEATERRRRNEREALADWQRRERTLAPRRSERAEALFSRALAGELTAQRESYRSLARREIPLQESLREELAALEAARAKLGAFAFSEKKANQTRTAEAKAELERSEQALQAAKAAYQAAEAEALTRLEAKKPDLRAEAEREITIEPAPEIATPAKKTAAGALEMLLAEKLMVGKWYGSDTLRAMLPEYEISPELMDKVLERLKRHNCGELEKTGDAVVCRFIHRLPRPIVKPGALKTTIAHILESGYSYSVDTLLRFFDERFTARDLETALSQLVQEGAARSSSAAGGERLYRSSKGNPKGKFDPKQHEIAPVDVNNLVSTPSAPAPTQNDEEPPLELRLPELEREEFLEITLMVMRRGEKYRAAEVHEKLKNAGFEFPTNRVSSMLSELVKQGRLDMTVISRARYYTKY